ncbi:MAG: PAS domain S-box protein [Thermoleophilia bacterium]|nr:PAS domain S-box protein [Thermoleophilia bacterium]
MSSSPDLLSAAAVSTACPICIVDAGGHVVALNRACEELTGMRAGDPWDQDAEPLAPGSRPAAGPPAARESSWFGGDGSRRRLRWTSVPLPAAPGSADLVACIGVDVTDAPELGRGPHESEERFRALADEAPVPIWTCDVDGQVTFFNRRWLELTGRGARQELGRGWEDDIHPDDRPRMLDAFDAGVRERRAYEVEYRLRDGWGQYRWMLERATPRANPDGTFAGFTGIVLDLTERRLATQALLGSEQRFRALFETAAIGIGIFGLDGAPVARNRAYSRIFGYTPEELAWLPAASFAVEERRDETRRLFAEVAAGRSEGFSIVEPCRRKDGERVWALVRARLLRTDDGAPRHVVCTVEDITEVRRAEEALRESEERYRELLENANDLVYTHDLENRLTSMNRAAEVATGISRERAIGRDIDELVSPEYRAMNRGMTARKLAGAPATVYESELLTADGRRIPIEVSSRLILEHGEPAGVQAIARDITERKRAERELRRREAILAAVGAAARSLLAAGRWEDAVDNVLAGLGGAADASRAYLFRNHPGEDGTVLRTCTHEWVALGVSAQLGSPGLSGKPYAAITRERLERGEAVALHTRNAPEPFRSLLVAEEIQSLLLVPIFAGSGWWGFLGFDDCRRERAWPEAEVDALRAAAGLIGAAIERQRAEELLRESEERFRQVVENIDEIFWLADPDGCELYVSPGFERALGVPWRGSAAFRKAIHPDDRERVRAAFARIREAPYDIQFRLVRPDGEIRWLRDRTFLVRGPDGEVVRVAGVATDITERKRANEERRELERQVWHAQKLESLGVLAGGVAHDFNNLLVGVLGNAGLALAELPAEAPLREQLVQIETAALRAAELTNQMLAYAGKGRFSVDTVDLSRLVGEMAHLLAAAISKKAQLRYDLASDLPAVRGDPTQLRQIVMNLITNASDALGEESGVIAVRTGETTPDGALPGSARVEEPLPAGSYVYVEVADTGCGMDERTRQRIFDPFFTTKFTGRGLGLAGVLGIVRSHGGTIGVASAPGAGTTFRILLPASAEPAAPPAPSQAATVAALSGTVLVADDEEAVRGIARTALERSGFTVLTAADGRECVELFRERPEAIDAVVLDLTMPVLGGQDALAELRAIRPGVPVVLSSGYTEDDVTARVGSDAGPTGFVQKPYRPSELVAAIRVALGF